MTDSNNQEGQEAQPQAPKKSSAGCFFWVLVVILIAIAVISSIERPERRSQTPAPVDANFAKAKAEMDQLVKENSEQINAVDQTEKRIRELEAQKRNLEKGNTYIDGKWGDFRLRNQRALARLMYHYNEASTSYDTIEQRIEPLVDKMCGFKQCVSFTYRVAADTANYENRSNRVEQGILSVLEPELLKPFEENARRLESAYLAFQTELEKSSTDFGVELGEFFEQDGSISQAYRPQSIDVDQIKDQVQGVLQAKVIASVGATIEVIFIKQSVKLIYKLFAKAAARVATSTAISAGAAVADGPLPIGEIIGGTITVASLAWTGYDLYDANKVLPRELKVMLYDTLNEQRQKTMTPVIQAATKYTKSLEINNDQLKTRSKYAITKQLQKINAELASLKR